MSVYKDLNEIEIDLTEFEEQPFSKLEKKRVQKKALKKLSLNKRNNGFSMGAAAAVLAVGLVAINHQAIANIPFVASLLEEWKQTEEVDWMPYKNTIGVTSTTQMGDLTVNEVIVDHDKILISATLQKTDATEFSYQHQLLPAISINGETVEVKTTEAQSIEQNSEMYTIYNQITMAQPIEDGNLSMQLIYDHMMTPGSESLHGEKLAEPWTFDITASQLSVQQQTVVKELNQHISLIDGSSFSIDRIITTPISTTIYYSGAALQQSPDITLYDESGQNYYWNSAYHEDDGTGIINYSGASFVNRDMLLEVFLDGKPISNRMTISHIQH